MTNKTNNQTTAAPANSVPENRQQTKIFAVVNQKGGVGKSTTATNLGTALSAVNRRVLLIDADPQGNASSGLGISEISKELSTYYLVIGKTAARDTIRSTNINNLDIIAANMHLSAAEVELPDSDNPSDSLAKFINPIVADYDYILIDCPPSLGFLTINALAACNRIIVPLQCEYFALEGLSHLLETVKRVRQKINRDLQIAGILLTMYDRRNNLSAMIEHDVRKHLKQLVYQTVIPRNVKVSEAPSHGQPVLIYDVDSKGAKAYIELAAEILRKEENQSDNGMQDQL